MLSLARQISHLDGYVKSGRWEDPVDGYVNHRGLELEGLTLGLIGLGAVGSVVSNLAGAFGMRVLAHDPYAGSQWGNSATAPFSFPYNRCFSSLTSSPSTPPPPAKLPA